MKTKVFLSFVTVVIILTSSVLALPMTNTAEISDIKDAAQNPPQTWKYVSIVRNESSKSLTFTIQFQTPKMRAVFITDPQGFLNKLLLEVDGVGHGEFTYQRIRRSPAPNNPFPINGDAWFEFFNKQVAPQELRSKLLGD